MELAELLQGARVIPVVVTDDIENAVPLAECLFEAGIGTIEITLRTDAALDVIRQIAAELPQMVVGAGSLREAVHVAAVKSVGASYGVAPGYTDALLDAAEDAELPMIPGAATPSEMMRLYERGYALQKFFPAELAGGIAFLKAVGAPLPELSFVPTGGIDAKLAEEYLALPNVFAVGGSWLTPKSLLDAGDFAAIGKLAADAAQLGL